MRMSKKTMKHTLTPIAAAVMLMSAGSASAVQFKYDNGVEGSFDTTVSYGVSVRMKDPYTCASGARSGPCSSRRTCPSRSARRSA